MRSVCLVAFAILHALAAPLPSDGSSQLPLSLSSQLAKRSSGRISRTKNNKSPSNLGTVYETPVDTGDEDGLQFNFPFEEEAYKAQSEAYDLKKITKIREDSHRFKDDVFNYYYEDGTENIKQIRARFAQLWEHADPNQPFVYEADTEIQQLLDKADKSMNLEFKEDVLDLWKSADEDLDKNIRTYLEEAHIRFDARKPIPTDLGDVPELDEAAFEISELELSQSVADSARDFSELSASDFSRATSSADLAGEADSEMASIMRNLMQGIEK